MAADAGVSRAHMSEIERKKRSATVDLTKRLADAMGVKLEEFFREPVKGAKKPKALPVGRKRTQKR